MDRSFEVDEKDHLCISGFGLPVHRASKRHAVRWTQRARSGRAIWWDRNGEDIFSGDSDIFIKLSLYVDSERL